jgi:tetratricopeptide (TPR) repeat protein
LLHGPSAPTPFSDTTSEEVIQLLIKPDFLSSLAFEFVDNYNKDMDSVALHLAVAVSNLALNCVPSNHHHRQRLAYNHAFFLNVRFDRFGKRVDVDGAVSVGRSTLEATHPGHSDHCKCRPMCLSTLGVFLCSRFTLLGELGDIENAISMQRSAVELTPDGHPSKHIYINNLGNSLQTRFVRFGNLSDLEDAFLAKRSAVDLTPDGNSAKPDLLNNLGSSYRSRFEHFGKLADLEDAISVQRNAVNLTPDGHINKLLYLDNLGLSFWTRFEHLEELADLENAISTQQSAVDLTPDDHRSKPNRFNNLGLSLWTRFWRLGKLTDIENAILAQRQAVDLTPNGHLDKPKRFNNLGLSFEARFRVLGKIADLENAISAQRNAVELSLSGHVERTSYLDNLGTSLVARFERLGEAADIEKAISTIQTAVDLAPPGHSRRNASLRSLGHAWRAQLRHSHHPSHFELAYDTFMSTFLSPSGSPRVKLFAARDAAKLCAEFPGFVQSNDMILRAHKAVLDALPSFIWLGQSYSHRYEKLSRENLGDSITTAAAAAVSANRPSLALEWLEEGRNVVWGQLLGLRSPVDELRIHNPSLAEKLQKVSAALERAGSRTSTLEPSNPSELAIEPRDPSAPILQTRPTLEDQAREHTRLASEYEMLIAEVRQVAGFEGFLRAKTLAELSPACRDGPVVIINVHRSRCDALVLCPQMHVVHVPLPELSLDIALTLQNLLTESIHGRAGVRLGLREEARGVVIKKVKHDMRHVLKVLWRRVVEPILRAIEPEVRIAPITYSQMSLTALR